MDKPSLWTSSSKLFNLLILLLFILACGFPNTVDPLAKPSQSTDHIVVSLTEPLDGEAYPISAGLSIRGEAISDGSINRMELWADGELYEEYTAPEDGLGLLVHYWAWSPVTYGTHTLMVRAYNDQGQSAFSNVINIKGIPDPGFVLIAEAEEGDTVSSIAERYNVAVDEIISENPNLESTTALSTGEEVFVHVGAPAIVSMPSTGAKVLMKLNELSANMGLNPEVTPSAPALTVTGRGCTAKLVINDSSTAEKGFNIYRLSPGTMSFSKLTTLPAHNGGDALSYTDSNLYGLYHYYVAAFDNDGEAASNLVSLKIIDSNCAGEPTTIDSLAFVPAGVNEYYLYVSINGGDWRRFPANEFTYLKQSDEVDFGQVASALAPNSIGNITMHGEVWGMVNGTATLLGTFEKSIKTGQAPVKFVPAPIQNFLSTTLEVRGIPIVDSSKYIWHKEKGTLYTPEVFRFGTDANAAYGIWQVSSIPFQSGVSFNPACLLLAGKADGSGTPDMPFEFGIDFSQLKPKIESVQLSPFENSFEQTPVFISPFSPEKFDASPQQTVKQAKWGPGGFNLGGGTPVLSNFDPCAQNVSAEGAITYYVRIIPMSNGQSAGNPSNSVKLIYDPNGQIKITFPAPPPIPTGTYYDIKILKFIGVHVPEDKYEYCVVVVENNMPPGLWAGFKPGTVMCPVKDSEEEGFFGDLSKAIEDAFNFISGIYNKLSDWATELVEKLNPLCIQAKMASSVVKVGEKEVKDVCHYIAVIAVTAAKTYVGLPPSLPSFDQLTELGKDNLVELAAQELENQGIPCPEDCKKVIRQGIDYSLEQVKKSASNSSCTSELEEHGYKPLCLPSGIITKPDPRGQPAPAVVEVEVTRRIDASGPNFPEPKSCNATIDIYAKNDSHIGQSFSSPAGFTWKGVPIQGDLLNGTAAFPNLQPGTSTKIPIVLSPVSFWLDGHKQFVKKGSEPEHFDDWGILYQGARAVITADGNCKFEFPEGTGFTGASVDGDGLQVGPLGEAWNHTCHPYNCP